jgi:hypothetical protein
LNNRRILIGLIAWFLGIIVPVYHHVALHAAIAGQPFNNDITRMRWVWEFIPTIEWIYLAMMWIVGFILVGSGLLAGRKPREPEQYRQRGPRGFEVMPSSTDNADQ